MNSNNPRSIDFSYKKYSLEQLDNWVNDALNCEDLTPQDIYDTVVNVVDESVEYHKKYLTKSIELLSLLKGQRSVDFDYTATGEKFPRVCDRNDPSPECKKDWNDFWEENYYPEESHNYTEEELDAMCEAAAKQEEKDKCREYNLREAEYYNKRAELDAQHSKYYYDFDRNGKVKKAPTYDEMIAAGYEMTDDGFWFKSNSESKRWSLPVKQSADDYYIEFPDDLLEAANLKEGDEVEWIDRKDGTYQLRKITKPLKMDEC